MRGEVNHLDQCLTYNKTSVLLVLQLLLLILLFTFLFPFLTFCNSKIGKLQLLTYVIKHQKK